MRLCVNNMNDDRSCLKWELRHEIGIVRALIQTAREVVWKPERVLGKTGADEEDRGYRDALFYLLVSSSTVGTILFCFLSIMMAIAVGSRGMLTSSDFVIPSTLFKLFIFCAAIMVMTPPLFVAVSYLLTGFYYACFKIFYSLSKPFTPMLRSMFYIIGSDCVLFSIGSILLFCFFAAIYVLIFLMQVVVYIATGEFSVAGKTLALLMQFVPIFALIPSIYGAGLFYVAGATTVLHELYDLSYDRVFRVLLLPLVLAHFGFGIIGFMLLGFRRVFGY